MGFQDGTTSSDVIFEARGVGGSAEFLFAGHEAPVGGFIAEGTPPSGRDMESVKGERTTKRGGQCEAVQHTERKRKRWRRVRSRHYVFMRNSPQPPITKH